MPLKPAKVSSSGSSMDQDNASLASHVSSSDVVSEPLLPPSHSFASSSTATATRVTYEDYLKSTLNARSSNRPCYLSDDNSDDENEKAMLRLAGFRSAFRYSQPRLNNQHSLTARIYHRHASIKQWGTALAHFRNNEQKLVNPGLASSSSSSSTLPSTPASAAPTGSASKNSKKASKWDSQYWIYASPRVKRIDKDAGYSVCDHTWYADDKPLRASPSFTPAELSSLVPVTAVEACRQNHLTILRQMRVKVKNETLSELNRVMKSVTGEIDIKVLRLCETGELAKCRIYKTDDFNYTLISTEKILSGEPLGCWMGTLREKNTFVQRVGFESSFLHICSYEINAVDLPAGYEGPDLVVDASTYANESRFFRDPKWSHQQADANVTCRISWNQLTGLPYLVYVALADIPPHAELFLDWGDKCWMNIWRTQLTALSTNSHLAHMYLKSLQRICIDRGINPLPQLANSKFAIAPLPFDKANEEKNQFLDEELSPFASTSATTLSKKIKASNGNASSATAAAPAASPVAPSFIGPLSGDNLIPSSDVVFDHREADMQAAVAATAEAAATSQQSSRNSSTPSSPFTPSFNTHKAFCATTSHTMLTVFARAILDAQTREQLRMRRRLERHRLNQYRPKRKPTKPLVEGAVHVKGHHTFEMVSDPSVAFIKSRTRLGRECKVAVSESTKEMVAEAFRNLRAQDFPCSKDAAVIESGCVPKAAVYEVVGLKHPARFYTRPDQSPFSLVATADIPKAEAIGVYLGVFREFEEFHKVSDSDAMKQVFAYDCLADKIPGPPNPFLNEKQKSVPKSQQLAYRGRDMVVESLYYGNEIRFMNDAYGRSGMDGTVNAIATIVWDKQREWPCVVIRALHAIQKGDEIVCDYGDGFWNKVSRFLMMDHASYGDEVQLLIEETETWMKAHGLKLPRRPTDGDELPEVFTQNIETDVVIYPRFFLKPVSADSEGCLLTGHQAVDVLRASQEKMTQVQKNNIQQKNSIQQEQKPPSEEQQPHPEKKRRGRPKGSGRKWLTNPEPSPLPLAAATATAASTASSFLDDPSRGIRVERIQSSLRHELEGAVQDLHQELTVAAVAAAAAAATTAGTARSPTPMSDSDANDSGDELPLLTLHAPFRSRKGEKRKSDLMAKLVDPWVLDAASSSPLEPSSPDHSVDQVGHPTKLLRKE